MSTPQATSSRLSRADILNILALEFGLAITVLDPTLVSLNVTRIQQGLDMPGHLIGFVGSIATLTLAAAVLGAASMGDLFGRKRLFIWGFIGTILFDLIAVFAPNTRGLIAVRALDGVALALLLGLSLAILKTLRSRPRNVPWPSVFSSRSARCPAPSRRSSALFWSTIWAGAACSSSPRFSQRSRC